MWIWGDDKCFLAPTLTIVLYRSKLLKIHRPLRASPPKQLSNINQWLSAFHNFVTVYV